MYLASKAQKSRVGMYSMPGGSWLEHESGGCSYRFDDSVILHFPLLHYKVFIVILKLNKKTETERGVLKCAWMQGFRGAELAVRACQEEVNENA